MSLVFISKTLGQLGKWNREWGMFLFRVILKFFLAFVWVVTVEILIRQFEMVLMHLFLEMLRWQFSLERMMNCARDNTKEKLWTVRGNCQDHRNSAAPLIKLGGKEKGYSPNPFQSKYWGYTMCLTLGFVNSWEQTSVQFLVQCPSDFHYKWKWETAYLDKCRICSPRS